MSMIGTYFMVDESVVTALKNEEREVDDVFYDENYDLKDGHLEIDKAWHAIHFTLTGEEEECDSKDPLTKVVMHTQYLGEEDMGYGPPTYLSVEEVLVVNAALQGVTEADFRQKFDMSAMRENEIYPITEDEDEAEFFSYVLEHFRNLQAFFAKAAQEKKCIVFFVA